MGSCSLAPDYGSKIDIYEDVSVTIDRRCDSGSILLSIVQKVRHFSSAVNTQFHPAGRASTRKFGIAHKIDKLRHEGSQAGPLPGLVQAGVVNIAVIPTFRLERNAIEPSHVYGAREPQWQCHRRYQRP
jgi:hypothetical protein